MKKYLLLLALLVVGTETLSMERVAKESKPLLKPIPGLEYTGTKEQLREEFSKAIMANDFDRAKILIQISGQFNKYMQENLQGILDRRTSWYLYEKGHAPFKDVVRKDVFKGAQQFLKEKKHEKTYVQKLPTEIREQVKKYVGDQSKFEETKRFMQDHPQATLIKALNNKMSDDEIQILLELGAGVNERDPNEFNVQKQTPLMTAIVNDRPKIAHLLIQNKALINAKDFSDQTPLIYLAKKMKSGKAETNLAQELINAGADTTLQDKRRKTALDYAREWGTNKELIKLLENAQEE